LLFNSVLVPTPISGKKIIGGWRIETLPVLRIRDYFQGVSNLDLEIQIASVNRFENKILRSKTR